LQNIDIFQLKMFEQLSLPRRFRLLQMCFERSSKQFAIFVLVVDIESLKNVPNTSPVVFEVFFHKVQGGRSKMTKKDLKKF